MINITGLLIKNILSLCRFLAVIIATMLSIMVALMPFWEKGVYGHNEITWHSCSMYDWANWLSERGLSYVVSIAFIANNPLSIIASLLLIVLFLLVYRSVFVGLRALAVR